ncbi:MAG: adenylate cyclase [Solirubrobacteraceae bacterium]|jgi:CYTH domain-containing protein
MTEIERTFLIEEDPPLEPVEIQHVVQGYIAIDGDGTEVRIRRREGATTLTIKSADAGRTRLEEEIDLEELRFERLWPLTVGRRIAKDRCLFPLPGGLTAELDVHIGALAGLRVVEVEFDSEEDSDRFQIPDWFGREITGDQRYRNRELAVHGLPGNRRA